MSLSVEGFQSAFRYAEMFWQGLVCTLALSALTVLFGFILALILAVDGFKTLANQKKAK